MTTAKQKAITLVELLIVFSILVAIVGLLLPAVGAAREAARRLQCSSNLRNFAIGQILCMDTHYELPTSYFPLDAELTSRKERPWGQLSLPYVIDQRSLSLFEPVFSVQNQTELNTIQSVLLCPSSLPATQSFGCSEKLHSATDQSLSFGTFDYRISSGTHGWPLGDGIYTGIHAWTHEPRRRSPSLIRDGLSSTILGWETVGSAHAYRPNSQPGTLYFYDWQDDPQETVYFAPDYRNYEIARSGSHFNHLYHSTFGTHSAFAEIFWLSGATNTAPSYVLILERSLFGSALSLHPNVINVAMCDGSTRELAYDTSSRTFAELIGIDDGSKTH